MNKRGITWALALALIAASPLAGAQSDTERAGARAAASEGLKAFNEGRHADAIDLFNRAESLVHAPPHLLYIARASEKLGKLVKAREAYMKITREKLAANAPDAFRAAQENARTELSALEPRVPYLTILVKGDGADGAGVTLNDVVVPPALVGVPYPVDPGEHRLQATGTDVQSELVTVSLAEGKRETVELPLNPAPGALPPGAKPAASGTEPAGGTPGGGTEPGPIDPGPTPSSSGPSAMRIGSYVGLGVGVVGLAAGTIFAIQSAGKRGDANDLCPDEQCPVSKEDEWNSLDDDAESASTLATVGFIVGGVGVAAGVTLFILSSDDSKKSAGVTPWVGLGSAGVSGRF